MRCDVTVYDVLKSIAEEVVIWGMNGVNMDGGTQRR